MELPPDIFPTRGGLVDENSTAVFILLSDPSFRFPFHLSCIPYANFSSSGPRMIPLTSCPFLIHGDMDKRECCLIPICSSQLAILYMMFFTRRSTYYCCRNRPPQLETSGTSLITSSPFVYLSVEYCWPQSLGCRRNTQKRMALVDTT